MKSLYLGGNDLRSTLEMLFFMGVNIFRISWFTFESNCISSVMSACSASITSPAIKQSISENIFRCTSFVSFSFISIMENATSSLYMAHSGGNAELAEMTKTVSIVVLSSRSECAILMLLDYMRLLRLYIPRRHIGSDAFTSLLVHITPHHTTHRTPHTTTTTAPTRV